jgi:DNA-binding transcriptional regulator YiaG
MNTCKKHVANEAKLVPFYDASELLGMAGVYLKDAVREARCANCGRVKSIEIPNLEGLIAAVAVSRALHPLKLRGKEIRYLREALEMTAQEMSEKVVKVSPFQISKWENDKEAIGPQSETLLRLYVVDELARLTAIKVNRNAIFRMKSKPWRKIDEALRMHFSLKTRATDRTPVSRKGEPKWKEAA